MAPQILDDVQSEIFENQKNSSQPFWFFVKAFVLMIISWTYIRYYHTAWIQAFGIEDIKMFLGLAMLQITIFAFLSFLFVVHKFNPSYWKILKENNSGGNLFSSVLVMVFAPLIVSAFFGIIGGLPIAASFHYIFGFAQLISVDIAFITVGFVIFLGFYKAAL